MSTFYTRFPSVEARQWTPYDPVQANAFVTWFDEHAAGEQTGYSVDRLGVFRAQYADSGVAVGPDIHRDQWLVFDADTAVVSWHRLTDEEFRFRYTEGTIASELVHTSDGVFVDWLIRERGALEAAAAEGIEGTVQASGGRSNHEEEAESAVEKIIALTRLVFGEPDSLAGAKADRALVASYLNQTRGDLEMMIGAYIRDHRKEPNHYVTAANLVEELVLYLDDGTIAAEENTLEPIQDPAAALDEAIGADQFATIPGSRVLSWLLTIEYRMPDDLTNRYRTITSADMGHALALGLASVGLLTVENGGAA